MKKLFQNTVQPTFKMYAALNKMNIRRSISMKVIFAFAVIIAVWGVINLFMSGISFKSVAVCILCIFVAVSYVVFYFCGHNMLTLKSINMQGKNAYLEFNVYVYDKKIEVKSSKTKGFVDLKFCNRLYEDNQYFYISYNRKNIAKSFIVLDKDGFSLGSPDKFREFISDVIKNNKSKKT